MKQTDIKGYSDDELRQIWWKIQRNEIQALPYKIANYIIHADSIPVIGNEMTRKNRVLTIIGLEIQHRFFHGNLQPKVETPDATLDWVKDRVKELQSEYNAIDFNECQDECGNITDFTIYGEKLRVGGKLRGYKECRDYLYTHKQEG